MKQINTATILAAAMLCSSNSFAESSAATAEKAKAMIQAIEALSGEARLHLQARQRLIDAGTLVERRAAIIEFQAKCQKHGYSCIQPEDFNRITLDPGGIPKGRGDGPSDSTTLQRLMTSGNGKETRTRGRDDNGNKMMSLSTLQFSSNITWFGHTHNTVTLRINGREVTAVLGQPIPGTPYTVRTIRPNEIVLGDRDGGTRIVPVAWPSGTDVKGNGQGNGFQQLQMPKSPADSSMQLPLGSPPHAG